MKIKLSICIATYNRGRFIGETLDSILDQMTSDVELVIVDGASSDNTPELMEQYQQRYPQIRYIREPTNSGIDQDYDKVVGYATGEFCWLMTDDDLLRPGALARVLLELKKDRDVVIVNAEVRNADFSKILATRQLDIPQDRSYGKGDLERLYSECLNYLSFIGGVVIRRSKWLARDRVSYYGTLFVHVGVIFQNPPIENVYVISEPLILIRYGNAMWTSRGFEIWAFKWPEFVWSFTSFSDTAKRRVCHPAPWKRIRTLFYSRATGSYSIDEFHEFISPNSIGIRCIIAYAIAVFPAVMANIISVFYFSILNRSAQMMKYDLLRSRHATMVSRWFARLFWM
jgi:glycosyltransferase involved in cell wall biosynthesis